MWLDLVTNPKLAFNIDIQNLMCWIISDIKLDNGSRTPGTAVSGEGGGEAGEAEEDAGEQQARQRQDGRRRPQVHLHRLQVIQSCKMSSFLHRGNLLNQILPQEQPVNCDKSNT